MSTWFYDDFLYLEVENNTLYETINFWATIEMGLMFKADVDIAFLTAHVNSFLERHPIVPTYINASYEYGTYNDTYGNWSGMMGHVGEQISKLVSLILCSKLCFRSLKTKQI